MRVYIPFKRNLDHSNEITTSCDYFRRTLDIANVRQAASNLGVSYIEQYWGDVMVMSWTKGGIKYIQCFKVVDIKVDDLDFMDDQSDLVDFDTQYGRLR